MISDRTMVKTSNRLEKALPEPGLNALTRRMENVLNSIGLVHDFHIKFSSNGLKDSVAGLSEEKKEALLCILQVQMDNIIGHSSARNVRICLIYNDLGIILYISDDGVGFDLKKINVGEGLSNIYASTKFFGGSAEIITSPGEGCSLTVLIPCGKMPGSA